MNQRKQLSGSAASPATLTKAPGMQFRGTLQAKPASIKQPLAMSAAARTPVAPPAYRPQSTPKVLQAKVHGSAPVASNRPARGSASGTIQANIIGGTHALQARLNAWHTGPTRGVNPSAAQSSSSQVAQAASARNTTQSIQCKSSPGVEAFQVPLQPKSGGQPIPDQVRAKMETAFGADFSDVRVHIGQEAASLGAIAYTWGTNIHFAPGQYSPNTIQGQKLLGHELWHVVQQRSGRVSNPFGGGVAVVQDHALEAEADRMGVKAAMTTLVQKPSD